MARVQLALRMADMERSVLFYSVLFYSKLFAVRPSSAAPAMPTSPSPSRR